MKRACKPRLYRRGGGYLTGAGLLVDIKTCYVSNERLFLASSLANLSSLLRKILLKREGKRKDGSSTGVLEGLSKREVRGVI